MTQKYQTLNLNILLRLIIIDLLDKHLMQRQKFELKAEQDEIIEMKAFDSSFESDGNLNYLVF